MHKSYVSCSLCGRKCDLRATSSSDCRGPLSVEAVLSGGGGGGGGGGAGGFETATRPRRAKSDSAVDPGTLMAPGTAAPAIDLMPRKLTAAASWMTKKRWPLFSPVYCPCRKD